MRALPSAGIIPLLQQFCNNKDKDEHGFPLHPNARYMCNTCIGCPIDMVLLGYRVLTIRPCNINIHIDHTLFYTFSLIITEEFV